MDVLSQEEGFGLTLQSRVVRKDSTAAEPAPKDLLVLDLQSGRYYGLGDVGGFIWERLDGKRDIASVAVELSAHFEVDRDTAALDLLQFVSQLLRADLARIHGPDGKQSNEDHAGGA